MEKRGKIRRDAMIPIQLRKMGLVIFYLYGKSCKMAQNDYGMIKITILKNGKLRY